MLSCLLGIDAGTTNIKVVAFDVAGRELAQAKQPTPVRQQGPGHAVYLPDELCRCFAGLIRQVVVPLPRMPL